VACRGGEVVTLAQGQSPELIELSPGLERIAVDPMGNVFVATSDAEVIEVGASTGVRPPQMPLQGGNRVLNANTPKRLLPLPNGGVAMLFQQSVSGELTSTSSSGFADTYSGTSASGYCASPASRSSMTSFSGGSFSTPLWLPGTQINDATVSPSGKLLVVADAAGGGVRFHGMLDAGTQLPPNSGHCSSPTACSSDDPVPPGSNTSATSDRLTVGASIPVHTPLAVGYSGTTLVIVNGFPSLELQTVPLGTTFNEGQPLPMAQRIPLRDRQQTPLTEGFNVFHSGAQVTETDGSANAESLACASCHPDGMTNGATVTLSGVTHRVMPLAGHLKTATKIHWDGSDFHSEVALGTWHTNMGGTALTTSQENSLRAFIGQLQMPLAPTPQNAAQIAEGRAAFTQATCDTCHDPTTAYTNDQTADVGKGMHKVPSLVGLVYTAPYLSDGCAKTLEQRLTDVACGGGDMHGKVSSLTPEQVTALVAFLKTL
jgi:cytochrome c553